MDHPAFLTWLRQPAPRRKLLMGVLNVTPDSFSDGGRYADPRAAADRGLQLAGDGADLIDIGGESTRPGADPVDDDEQIQRVAPVLREIRSAGCDVSISIDTTRSVVAAAALDAGANFINDISAGRDDEPAMFRLAARKNTPIVLMHMLGRPKTMQAAPHYQDDVVAAVAGFLNERLIAAGSAGIDLDLILLDPGIGFGKAVNHNLALLQRLRELTVLGRPLLLGTSRKGFLGRIAGEDNPRDRVVGTAASVAWTLANGADIVRVHDVGEMVKVKRVIEAILDGGNDR